MFIDVIRHTDDMGVFAQYIEGIDKLANKSKMSTSEYILRNLNVVNDVCVK